MRLLFVKAKNSDYIQLFFLIVGGSNVSYWINLTWLDVMELFDPVTSANIHFCLAPSCIACSFLTVAGVSRAPTYRRA